MLLNFDSSWNHSALLDAYVHRLAETIKDQLIALDLLDDLDALIAFIIKIQRRLIDRQRERY